MKRGMIYTWVWILSYVALSAKTWDMEAYVNQTRMQDSVAFLEGFPYKQFLQEVSLEDFERLDSIRGLLDETPGRNGDAFLSKLFQVYRTAHPVQIAPASALLERIELGQTYLELPYKQANFSIQYEILGDILLTELSDTIQKAIDQGLVSKRNKLFLPIFDRLKAVGYPINLPVSDFEKFCFHVKEGNFSYIWDRVQKRYLTEFFLIVGVGILLLIFMFQRLFNKAPKNSIP